MKTLLLKLEPLIWFMFGQGIMIGTMLLTPWILVLYLLVPFGIVDGSEALSYDRALRLTTSSFLGLPIGKLVLAAVAILPLWKGAHHVRSLLVDLGGGERDAIVGTVLYGVALFGSVAAVMGLVAI
jgi:fumarate reductase subunit D